jgi:membrane associated rhomboid family serine protease
MLGIIPYGTNEPLPRRRFPYVTTLLVLANVAVFIYEVFLVAGGGEPALTAFVQHYAVTPAHIMASNWLDPTLITSIFLHGGVFHLVSNMLFLMAFGDNVEDRLGPITYLIAYLLWGIAGNIAHILLNPGLNLPSLGASGAIAGVLGAYLVLFPRGVVRVFFFFFIFFTFTRLPAILIIGSWFVMQLFSGLGSLGAPIADTGGVAVWAHIGGFIAGVATALALRRPDPREAVTDPS